MSKKCSALEGGACLASKAQSLEVWRVCGLRVHCCDEGRLFYKSNNSNNAPSPCKRTQHAFHVACVGRTTCQFAATCVSTCFLFTEVFGVVIFVQTREIPICVLRGLCGTKPTLYSQSWRICFAKPLLRLSAGTLAARQNFRFCVGKRWTQILETCVYA